MCMHGSVNATSFQLWLYIHDEDNDIVNKSGWYSQHGGVRCAHAAQLSPEVDKRPQRSITHVNRAAMTLQIGQTVHAKHATHAVEFCSSS